MKYTVKTGSFSFVLWARVPQEIRYLFGGQSAFKGYNFPEIPCSTAFSRLK